MCVIYFYYIFINLFVINKMDKSQQKGNEPESNNEQKLNTQQEDKKKIEKQQQRYSSFVPVQISPQKSQKKVEDEQNVKSIFDEKTNKAVELKNSGNAFFKKKDYVQAIKQYSSALKLLDPTYFYGATKDEMQKMAELSSILLCNMGFCYFNSHDMQRADLYFTQAIAINPKYVKALHKRSLARYDLQKFEQAFEDIKSAYNLQKSNKQIHQAYSKILQKYNEQVKKSKQQMKALSTKIFSNNESQKSASPAKKDQEKNNKIDNSTSSTVTGQKQTEKKWSWPSVIAFAGAAAFIGTGIYKMLRN